MRLLSIFFVAVNICLGSCKQKAKDSKTCVDSLEYIDTNEKADLHDGTVVDSSLYISLAEAEILDSYIKRIEILQEVKRFKINNDSNVRIKLYKRKPDSSFFYSSRTELKDSLIYEIQVGYDDALRYTNFFTFFINPQTNRLFYFNTISDSLCFIKTGVTKLPK